MIFRSVCHGDEVIEIKITIYVPAGFRQLISFSLQMLNLYTHTVINFNSLAAKFKIIWNMYFNMSPWLILSGFMLFPLWDWITDLCRTNFGHIYNLSNVDALCTLIRILSFLTDFKKESRFCVEIFFLNFSSKKWNTRFLLPTVLTAYHIMCGI